MESAEAHGGVVERNRNIGQNRPNSYLPPHIPMRPAHFVAPDRMS